MQIHSGNSTFRNAFLLASLKGVPMERDLLYTLLQNAITARDLSAAREAHSIMTWSTHTYACVLYDRLIHLFGVCGSLVEASIAFCLVPKPSCHTWHAILSTYVESGFCKEGLHLFGQMQCKGFKPSKVTLICILKACGILSSLRNTMLIHAFIINKVDLDMEMSNVLIDAYARGGNIVDACHIFEKLKNKDVISWNVLMAGYAHCGLDFLIPECLYEMQMTGVNANIISFSCALNACGTLGFLREGRIIHVHVLRSGLPLDIVVNNILIHMYIKCQNLDDALKVFSDFPDHDVVSWSTMIAGCAQYGHNDFALELFSRMQTGKLKPDKVAFGSALKACKSLRAFNGVMFIHGEIISSSFESDESIGSILVDIYANFACLNESLKVFNRLQKRDLVDWNIIIGSHVKYGQPMLALQLFERMQLDLVQHDEITSLWVLKACVSLGAKKEGCWIHDHAVRAGYESSPFLQSSLICMYGNVGSLEEVEWLHSMPSTQSTCVWNNAILGCQPCKEHITVSNVLEGIECNRFIPYEVLLSGIIKGCTEAKEVVQGRLIHDHVIRFHIKVDEVLGNSIISMYVGFGDMREAQKVFDNIPFRSIVSWNAILTGYCSHGFDFRVIELFGKLQQCELEPDSVSFLSVLKACGNIGAVIHGRLIHDLVLRKQLDSIIVCSTLVDMYSKCADFHSAQRVLYNMPKRNVVSWGAIISSYAFLGCLDSCRECIKGMEKEGLRPDARIFQSILVACSHLGLVEEGHIYFDLMHVIYGINPSIEHSNSIVNLLCRVGCFTDVKEFVSSMPIVPDFRGWMALFAASRLHGHIEIAQLCFYCAARLEPHIAAQFLGMIEIDVDLYMWNEENIAY
ncbi:hypothetical protein KP509_21G053500 [Ceratopteris richardii]|uniref:Pentatricopeptide repeat-containing protein n=1 Tax=Ceratopteris richardii TaxID=49495 RepID=A0A8T2SAG9_CERRI|nr:hypothetical protein KP509_21G053500 [Ceratopteris richardii]